MKLLTIVGARPQIIKAAALTREIRNNFSSHFEEIVLHTGQHYDYNMSDVFIEEFQIPQPDINLHIGSGSHGEQTGKMIIEIEKTLNSIKPDCCIVYGDTNSTLAGAVAAAKLKIPVVHIEAGLRSFDKTMPEELNRIACDHFSTILFAPTKNAVNNLKNEGFKINSQKPFNISNPAVFLSGDIMLDNTLFAIEIAQKKSKILQQLNLNNNEFALCTIHRENNTDNYERLFNILSELYSIANELSFKIVLPIHPRTKKAIQTNFTADFTDKILNNQYLQIIEPVSFFDIVTLETNSKLIITDSGGVQKEAYFMKKPCIVLRDTTEWVELLENNSAILVDDNREQIRKAFFHFMKNLQIDYPPVFGEGKTANFICQKLLECF